MWPLALVLALTEPAGTVARRGGIELRWNASAERCPVADEVLDDAIAALAEPPSETQQLTA